MIGHQTANSSVSVATRQEAVAHAMHEHLIDVSG